MEQDTNYLDDLVPCWLSIAVEEGRCIELSNGSFFERQDSDRKLQDMISRATNEWMLHVYPSDLTRFQRPARVLLSVAFAQVVNEDPVNVG